VITCPGKLGLQQRVLPEYRRPFFEALAQRCQGGLALFAGQPRPQEAIKTVNKFDSVEFTPAKNIHLFSGPLYLCRQPGIVDWLESWQPDALVVEANPRYLSTPAAVEWMHAHHKPVLGWGLGAPPLQGVFMGLRRRSRRKLLHSLDGVISYSQRGAEEYRAQGIPAEQVFVAHNAAVPAPVARLIKRGSHFAGQPTVLFVGRLQGRKRLDILFKACAAQSLRPRLLVVGDGPERAMLERQASLDYPGTQFLGSKFGSDLDEIFNQADLFVLPGTGGLAVQQAMGHSLPVVVAQGDGTQEDLVRPGNGWLVPPSDLTTLIETIRQALSDVTRLRAMGAESFRIVQQEINLETMIEAFIQAVNAVAGQR
jgi:glycosyltransferase involved in cell wall biosynthesis